MVEEKTSKGDIKDVGNKPNNAPTNKVVDMSKSPNKSFKLKGGNCKLKDKVK